MKMRHAFNELSFVLMFWIGPATAGFAASGSIFPDTLTPATEYYDAPGWELGTIFRPTAPGVVTQVRVFSLADEAQSTNHVVSLWQNSPETLLFRTNWNFGGDAAWITLPIPNLRVQANGDYTISITAPEAGMYPANSSYFATPADNGHYLSWPQGAGVFSDTAGDRPTTSYEDTAYLRDIVFEPDSVFPIIGVQGKGLAIPAGNLTPSLSDGTQFGGVPVGSNSPSATFTIANSGTANLVLGPVQVIAGSGLPSGDFVVVTQPGSPVAPGATTTFTIQFAPAAAGTRDATLVITNNAAVPYQFALEGVGIGGGVYTVLGNKTASTVTSIPAGQVTGSRFQALRNLRLTQLSVWVAASSNAVLKSAIYSDSAGVPDQFLSGTAELANPTNGWNSLPLTQPVNVGVLSNYWLVVWANADQIWLYADTAGRLQAGSYPYDVAWPNPLDLSGGSGSGTLCLYAEGLPTDSTGPEMEVQGNGSWVASGGTNMASANGTDFGGCSLYGGTRSQTYTILNIGQTTLTLSGTPSVTIAGAAASDFVVTSQPAASVVPGGSTTFTVKFTPSAAGLRHANVLIAHADSPASPYSFAVQGQGLNLSGAGLIGNDGVGTDSRPIGAVITGNRYMAPADLRITELRAKIIKSSANFACAVYSDNNGVAGHLLGATAVVPAATNGWNTYPLTTPLDVAAGNYYWLMLASDSGGAAVQMDYTGTGYLGIEAVTTLSGAWPDPLLLTPIANEPRTYCIYAEGTPLAAAPGAAMDLRGGGLLIVYGDTVPSTLDGTDFGNVPTKTGALDHTFTIENSGAAPLLLTGSTPVVITGPQAGDFQVSKQPTSPIPARGSTTFIVRFAPSATGLRNATLSVTNNDIDPDKNPYQFAVQGAGFVVGRESLFPDSQVGADVDNDGTQYDLGVIFSSFVNGNIIALRVFSIAGDAGTHTGWIWNTSDGTALAGPYTWDFGGVTGWIYLDIPPVPIQAGNQYTVDITTGQGPMHDYANIAGILTDAGGNGLDLSYPTNAGVFLNPPNSPGPPPLNQMPDQSWNGSSYLRDIVFVPQGSSAVFPVMGVMGNANSISDGYSSPVASNNTYFGTAPANAGTVDLSFTLTNSGSAPLNLTTTPQVAISGPQASDFKVVTQPTTPIAAGGSSALTIRFQPSALGLRKARVTIDNDDKNPFYFAVSGTGTNAPAPFKISKVTPNLTTGDAVLTWQGGTPPYQVRRAMAVTGPFIPIGAPQSGTSYTDLGILKTNAVTFYRISY